ncbi:hypothetical protein R3P38DRAFT_2792297 [Favolaschia claudopus]|uniref:Uncharacterized protein n=1 Tax=Favolaschia claudopus TaxID=2862362 RepID=A0AAW0AE58_9AGAR
MRPPLLAPDFPFPSSLANAGAGAAANADTCLPDTEITAPCGALQAGTRHKDLEGYRDDSRTTSQSEKRVGWEVNVGGGGAKMSRKEIRGGGGGELSDRRRAGWGGSSPEAGLTSLPQESGKKNERSWSHAVHSPPLLNVSHPSRHLTAPSTSPHPLTILPLATIPRFMPSDSLVRLPPPSPLAPCTSLQSTRPAKCVRAHRANATASKDGVGSRVLWVVLLVSAHPPSGPNLTESLPILPATATCSQRASVAVDHCCAVSRFGVHGCYTPPQTMRRDVRGIRVDGDRGSCRAGAGYEVVGTVVNELRWGGWGSARRSAARHGGREARGGMRDRGEGKRTS